MPLFFGEQDVELINSLNNELITDIIGTTVDVYKISIYDSIENLYGEAINKIYFPAVRVAGLIEHGDPSYESDEFGPNITQEIIVSFLRDALEDIDLYPEIGDVIEYNNKQYEINSAVENQFLGGQTSLNHSIICICHITKKSRTKIDNIKRAYEYNVDSLYT